MRAARRRDDALVLAGGSNVVLADDLTDLTVVRLANTGITVDGDVVRAEAGRGVGRRRRRLAGARPGRAGMPVGHPRLGGRDPGAERRRVRRRGRRHHPPGPAARPAHRRGPLGGAGDAPVRLPHKHSARIRRPRSCSRWSSRWTPTGAARRCATASWPTALGAEPGSARRPGAGARGGAGAARRQGHGARRRRPRHLERRVVLHQPGRDARRVRAADGAVRRARARTTRRPTG